MKDALTFNNDPNFSVANFKPKKYSFSEENPNVKDPALKRTKKEYGWETPKVKPFWTEK
jgi:hypothetical protein